MTDVHVTGLHFIRKECKFYYSWNENDEEVKTIFLDNFPFFLFEWRRATILVMENV